MVGIMKGSHSTPRETCGVTTYAEQSMDVRAWQNGKVMIAGLQRAQHAVDLSSEVQKLNLKLVAHKSRPDHRKQKDCTNP
jgi:hypothetical protein